MLKKTFLLALFACALYSPCEAVTSVEKLVDDFATLPVVEQRRLSDRMAGTHIYTATVAAEITEPGLFERFAKKLYYKVTSQIMTSPVKKKEFKVIYCYTNPNKALSFKKGDRIKGYGTLMKIEAGMFWVAVWLEMD